MNEILKKNGGPLQQSRVMRFRFIESNKSSYPVDEMCECLDVSRSGYYARQGRGPSERSLEDKGFKQRIGELHKKSKGRYGYRPIYHHLKDENLDCGRDRTLRLMNEMGLEGLIHHSDRWEHLRKL